MTEIFCAKRGDYVKKYALHYYIITLLLATLVFFNEGTYLLGPQSAGYRPSDLAIIFFASFGMAVDLGLKNIPKKWLFPISTALYVCLVPAVISLLIHFESYLVYYLMYGLAYHFIFIFPLQLIIASAGIVVGLLIRKRQHKEERP